MEILFIVLDYVPGGELLAQIIERPFRDPEASYVLKGMAAGLQWLHTHHIAHRDLKPENVLISHSRVVVPLDNIVGQSVATGLGSNNLLPVKRLKMHDIKIADFGLSKEIPTHSNPVNLQLQQTHQSCVGTLMYAAPEVFDAKEDASFGVDIWAMGVKNLFKNLQRTYGIYVRKFHILFRSVL